jgi:penicillin amidase
VKRLVAASLLGALVSLSAAGAADPQESRPERIPGLKAAAQITQDREGIYHVRANNEEDAFFLQGWVHARDRLFQMDQNRRLSNDAIPLLLGQGEVRSNAARIERFVPAR